MNYRVIIISKFELDELQSEQLYSHPERLPEGWELLDFLNGKDDLDVGSLREMISLMRIGE